MSDLKIQGVVEVSSEGAEGAFSRVGNAAEKMARTTAQAADKAGKAVGGIGDAAGTCAENFTRAEGRISDSIKRATRNLEEFGKTASQKLEMRISSQGLDVAKFEPFLAKLREIEAAQVRATASGRRFGSGLQNTSYQLQDFIVQVNGGTDATRALGQQLPQLLGGFGAIGAAFGVVAALLPNLIGLFSDSAGESKKLSDAMSDFDKAIGNVGQTVKTFDMEKLYEQFNGSSAAVRAATLEQIKFQQALIETERLTARKSFGKSVDGLGEYSLWDNIKNGAADAAAMRASTDRPTARDDAALQAAKLAEQLGVTKQIAVELLPVLRGLEAGSADVTSAFDQFGTKLLSGNKESIALAKSMRDFAQSERDAAAALSASSEAQEKMASGRRVTTKKELEEAAKASKAAKKEMSELDALLNGINGKDSGFSAEYVGQVEKLLKAYDSGALSLEKFNSYFSRYVAMQPGAVAAAKELAKAKEDAAKAEAEYHKALSIGSDALEQQAANLEREVEFYGMSESAIQSVIIARMEEARAIAAANGAYPEHLAYLDREIDARKRIAAAAGSKDALDANKRSIEQNAKAWEKFSDDIERSLTDSLYRSFEAGGNFGKTFADTLKNSLKTIGIKFAVQMLVQPVMTGLAGMLGGNGQDGGQQRGENGELLGYAKQGYDILNMGNTISKAGSMVGNGISYVGNATGSAAMSGFGAGFSSGVGEAMLGNAFVGPSASLAGNSSIAAGSNAGSFLSSYGGYLAAGLQLLQGDVKGAAWTAAGTAVGSVFGPVGAGIGAVVGSLLGGIFGGGGEQYKRQVTSSYGEYTNGKFSDYGADPNYFPSSKRLGESTDDALAMVNKQYSQTLGALFKAFDIDEQIKTSSGFRLRRTSGKWIGGMTATVGDKQFIASGVEGGGDSEGLDTVLADFAEKALSSGIVAAIKDSKLPDEIENLFDLSMNADGVNKTIQSVIVMQGALKAADSSLVEFAQSFKPEDYAIGMETIAETTSRLALRLLSVNDVFSDLNLQAFALTGAGGNLASTLVDLMGGVEGFTSATTGYYENYFSQEERMDDLRRRATESLAQVGLALPESREAFRALVESLDLTTDSGQSSFSALMKVQGAFAQLTDAASTSAQKMADAARSLLAQQVTSQIGNNVAGWNAAADAGLAALERAAQMEMDRATAAQHAAQEQIGALDRIFGVLDQNIQRLYQSVSSTASMGAADALAAIETMVRTAASTGYLPDADDLSAAISAAQAGIGGDGATTYETARDRLVLAGHLSQLKAAGAKQLPVAEQALAVARQQYDAAQKTLERYADQINAMLGIQDATWSLSGTLEEVGQRIVDALAANAATISQSIFAALDAKQITGSQAAEQLSKLPAQPGVTVSATGGILTGSSYYTAAGDKAQRDVAQRVVADAFSAMSPTEFYSAAQSVGLSGKQIEEMYGMPAGTAAEWAKANGLPAFAVGTDRVPADMLALVHQGERITPAAYTGQQEKLIADLITEVRRLQAIVASGNAEARRTADAVNGRPEAPLLVEMA